MKLIPNLADIDRKAVGEYGIPARALMENAGTRLTETVRLLCLESEAGVVLCGPGNNGGDGFVCARLLQQAGYRRLTVIYTSTAYRNEALENLEHLMALPIELINAKEQPDNALKRIGQADYVIDALFGSGLSRPIEGLEARFIKAANDWRAQDVERRVIAVDMPSGIDGIHGQIQGMAVRADVTVTFGVAKPGLYLYPGKAHAGEVVIADIGLPPALIEADESVVQLITDADARAWLPERLADSHKYSYGHVLVIAGSHHMPGAAVLCAEAAMNCGAGLVTLAAPSDVFRQVPLMPEIIRLPLPDVEHLGHNSLPVLQEALARGKYTAVLIGPGLDQAAETFQTVGTLLETLKPLGLPVIIDADGLNALVAQPDCFPLGSQFILTPHVGECARLLGQETGALKADMLAAAAVVREKTGAQVVLKSASTVVATDKDQLWISPVGNPGMATAGSGDVLSGIIAAQAAQLQAQGKFSWQAAVLGVYLHGLAGDAAAEAFTPYAMCASDITRHLPDAFKTLLAVDPAN